MKTLPIALAVLLASTPALAAPEYAQVYKKIPVADVEKVLDDMGIEHETSVDSYGDPIIFLSLPVSGFKAGVVFYDCEDDACSTIQLDAAFTMTESVPLETINDWNRSKRWSKCYLTDEGQVHLDSDLRITKRKHKDQLQLFIEHYDLTLVDFASHLGW